jgi:hypothetical protein
MNQFTSRYAAVASAAAAESAPVIPMSGALRICLRQVLASAAARASRASQAPTSNHVLSAAILIFTLLFVTTGCSSTSRTLLAQANTTDTAEIYVHPAFGTAQRAKLAVLPFKAPPYAVDTANVVTETYYQELLRTGGFHQVTLVRELPHTQRHLPPWQALKDFDLVMQGEVVYVLSGTGSSPTQLQVEVRIVDVSRGTMAWYLRQQCVSQPGQEVDLIWSTVPAQPARAYQDMAAVLARKFVQIITAMPENNPDARPETYPAGNPPVGTDSN